MLFRVVRPMFRKGSRSSYFQQRIPVDLRNRLTGLKLFLPVGDERIAIALSSRSTFVKVSLRTTDPSVTKVRQAEVAAYLEAIWEGIRADAPVVLTHKQCTALAGDLYRAWVDGDTGERTASIEIRWDGTIIDTPRSEEEVRAGWAGVIAMWAALGEDPDPSALGKHLGPIADRFLLTRGLPRIDSHSRETLVRALYEALRDAFKNRQKNAEGDYAPDPKASRFPEWSPPTTSLDKPLESKVSLLGLVDGWWVEAKAGGVSPSTYEAYRRKMERLIEFLGAGDATLATPQTLLGFKDMRLASGIKAQTVKDNDLSALRAVFGWAVMNRKIASNPAKGITLKVAKSIKTRAKGFTSEEATAILKQAFGHTRSGSESPKVALAKRWVPWLCAYTGARVGELAQLRKKDLRLVGKDWVMTITPEAGTVKDKEVREVVLHPHLVEQGFPDFVDHAKAGYLFITPDARGEIRGSWRALKNRLAEFARVVVKDVRVAPNHGWRHTFKTVGRQAGIEDSVLDAICGHAPGTVGGDYGDVTLEAQVKAFERFPRFASSKDE